MEVVHNHNAKSQLAKLLATENITVQHSAAAKTAMFDTKKRVLILPVWREMSNDLYDMLVVHEVGHALDTPVDGWLDALSDIAARVTGSASNHAVAAVKGFLNVIEDARIDKRQKRRFPGARRNYVKGYAELIEKDFFGTKTKDVNSMSFIDRLNIYFKGGAMSGIKFTAEEKSMVDRVDAAETFDEVLALTEEIFGWSKSRYDQDEPETDKHDMRDKSGMSDDDAEENEFGFGEDSGEDIDDEEYSSGSSYDDDEYDTDDENNSDSDDDDEGDTDDEDDSDSDDDGNGDGDDKRDSDPLDIKATKCDDIPESETEKAWQKNQNDLVVKSDEEYIYVKIPRPVKYDQVVNDYKVVLADQRKCIAGYWNQDWLKSVREELQRFKANENASISFMVKEFEMRKSADEHSRTSVAKTGVIDTNKLHSYRYNDDLFRRITTVASGKNHGFVMFVDWSGSMDLHLKKTVKQLLSLTMFCKRVQIPFEVYSFRSMTSFDVDNGRIKGSSFTKNQNELDFDNFVARNLLSSRMNIAEFNDAMFHLYVMACYGGHFHCDNMTSTPLNECIGVADLIINRFKAKSRVQIVNTIFLTDGDSDPIDYIHGLPSSWKTRKYILQDEITKKSYDIRSEDTHSYYPYSDRAMTGLLLRVLKDRTGCNLIGFYITSYGFTQAYGRVNGQSGKAYKKATNDWKNNGFFGATTSGYDEYYIINHKSFDVSSGKLAISSDMTKKKIASEFIKFSEKKAVSRVLLSRFVKRIAA
jgi:hypothetical protein